MTGTVYIVVRGNSQTSEQRIVEVYDDETAAYTHMYGLIFEGRVRTLHDYVDVYERTPKSEPEKRPNFDYRVKFTDVLEGGNSPEYTEWVDKYDKARGIADEILNGKTAVHVHIQRRNDRSTVEETRRNQYDADPWDNSWSKVEQ